MKNLLQIPLPDDWLSIARIFTALGDPQRQRILLSFEPGERLNVGQIVEGSELSRSAISHHLKVLKEAGVLDSRKEGKEVYFWINKSRVLDALQTVQSYLHTDV